MELVSENTFTATGLTPETEYEWSVRAVKGDKASDWVEGPGFSTFALLEIEFPFTATKYYMGTQTAAGTSNFWIVFNSFDPIATGAAATGWQLALDFYSTLVEKNADGCYDIPDGTYTFGTTKDANVINLTGMTRFTQFNEGTRITPDFAIRDGEVNISGNPDEYIFEGYLNLEDGRRVEFTYQGEIIIK